MKINAVIENKDGGTLVLDFPRSIYDVYVKLQSVGIRKSPHQITLSDEEGDDVRVKLYSEDEAGKHLLLTLNEQNSLADANMLAFMADNAKADFRSKLEQNLLHDQYGSMQEVTDAIKQMLYESGPVKAVFYCPLVGEVTDDEGFSSPVDGRFLKSYRRQIVRGKAYWMCSGRASGATICSSQRMSESDVYEAFSKMLFKLKKHHQRILGALIQDIEVMQSKTSENHEKIAEIDKEIADLAARNLVIVRLHTSGILNGSDYSAQSSEINNRINALRSERKKKLAEDEGDEQLDKLKELQGILDEYEPTESFDEDLFNQIVEKASVMSKTEIAFHLIGGLKLIETIV